MPLLSTFGAASARSFGGIGAAGGGVPIEYVGYKSSAYSPTSSSSTQSLSLSGTLTGGTGGTIQQDDLVIVSYLSGTLKGYVFTLSFNTSGYTSLFNAYANQTGFDGASSQHLAGYKIMGSTPDTSVVINQQANQYQTSWGTMIIASVFRYVDTSNPIDASVPTPQYNLNSTNPSFNSITTATKNAVVYALGSNTMHGPDGQRSNVSMTGSYFSNSTVSLFGYSTVQSSVAHTYLAIESPSTITPTAASSPVYTSSVDPYKAPSSIGVSVALRPATP